VAAERASALAATEERGNPPGAKFARLLFQLEGIDEV
jgi:hypothetical protein